MPTSNAGVPPKAPISRACLKRTSHRRRTFCKCRGNDGADSDLHGAARLKDSPSQRCDAATDFEHRAHGPLVGLQIIFGAGAAVTRVFHRATVAVKLRFSGSDLQALSPPVRYLKGISFAALGRIAMPKRINMPSPTTRSVQLPPMK